MTGPSPRDQRTDRWAWREAGPARGGARESPVLVLLHGLGGSRISWEPQLAELSDRRRVIAWDLPGYGDAPPLDIIDGEGPALTFPRLADAAARFLVEVALDGDPTRRTGVHVVGISFGGMVAQHLAARHPHLVASLGLLATSPKFGLDGTDPAAWRAARLAPLDAGREPEDFAGDVLARLAGPSITADALAGQRAAMSRVPADGLRRTIECLVTHDSRELLPAIAAPTLVLVGELDDETPPAYARAIADHIPGAALVVIPGAGHLLNVEAPDTVNRHLAHHVDLHTGARAGAAGGAR